MITNKNQEEMEIFIKEYMPIKKAEKKQFGEVFTPIHLINSMLDTLPKELFQNPNLKWLDPTAGIGNFMIILYFRLMDELKSWQPDIEKRSNHILENMLYMIEINETNVEICKNIFLIKEKNKYNIICKDFLSHEKDTNYLHFDIIIGNPPFQDKAGKGGKNKLYEKIICKCLDILNTNSYLLFLVPDNLFSGNSSKTYLKLLNCHLHYIDFRQQITHAFHGIQQKICCFLLEKKDYISKLLTNIYSDNSNTNLPVQLTNRPINPIRNWNLETESWFQKYITLTKNPNVVYNRGLSLDNYNKNNMEINYTLIYTPTTKLYTNNIKLAKGFGKKKIIFFLISIKGEYFIDWKGEYGVGPNTIFISFEKEEEGKKLDTFFKSNDYKKAVYACKTCRQFFKIALLQYLHVENNSI